MAMIKLPFVCFIILSLFSCSEEIHKEKLLISSSGENYIIHLSSNKFLQIVNDSSEVTKLVFENNEKINLDFYIIEPYLTEAYFCEIGEMGKVLILESYPVGASGLSANIINVSIIALDKKIFKVLSYNSFHKGIDLLKYKSNKIILTLYDFNGYDNNNMTYCMNTFEFLKGKFILKKSKSTICYIYNGEFILNNNCNRSCGHLEEPYVLPRSVTYGNK